MKDGEIISSNTRHYPTAPLGSYPTAVSVVLVAGSIGDYAAYAGCGSKEFVARFGDKISFEEAQIHFPIGLKRELYRD